MPKEVEIKVKDEREITAPIPADAVSTKKLADFVATATSEGFCLAEAAAIQEDRGNQYDPFVVTTGLRLTYRRKV